MRTGRRHGVVKLGGAIGFTTSTGVEAQDARQRQSNSDRSWLSTSFILQLSGEIGPGSFCGQTLDLLA